MNRLFENLRSRLNRLELELEPRDLVIRLLAATFVLSLVAVVAGLLGPRGEWDHFFWERRPMTLISFLLILFASFLCWEIYRARKTGSFNWTNPVALWAILGIGFTYLAFDELLKFHENIDRVIHKIFEWSETELSDRIDDLIVFLYACAGGAVLMFYRGEVDTFRPAVPFLLAAFGATVVMVGLDVLTTHGTLVPSLFSDATQGALMQELLRFLEEYAKFVAEIFFIGAFYTCWRMEVGIVTPMLTTIQK